MILEEKSFENIEGKGENAGNQHFLHSPQCFLPNQRQIAPNLSLDEMDICKCFQFGQGLKPFSSHNFASMSTDVWPDTGTK